jgi:hypothetical protein
MNISKTLKELFLMRPVELLYIIGLISLACEDPVALNMLNQTATRIVESIFGVINVEHQDLIGFPFFFSFFVVHVTNIGVERICLCVFLPFSLF